jgi:putative ABC transport system ATP-binding protein
LNQKILELRDVTFRYRLSQRDYSGMILKGINLTLHDGEILVLIGPSGAGKSTLLRIINRLVEPSGGVILFRGINTAEIAPQKLRKDIALVSQEPYLIEGTIHVNLLIPYEGSGKEAPPEPQCHEVLASVGLPQPMLERRTEELSVGERHRVSIARTLMTSPSIILLDEPTAALDQTNWEILSRTIRRINSDKKIAFVVVTHLEPFARSLSGRFLKIREGTIVAS